MSEDQPSAAAPAAQSRPLVTALAGGVGAARMLRGIAAVVGQPAVTAVVNTGDDIVLHGLHVSPDIDTVTYSLAGVANPETGWGVAGESWATMEALRAFETPSSEPGLGAGSLTWFALGDKDIATHLYRTGRLGAGATLSEVTLEIAARWGVSARLLPMSDARVETRVTVELAFPGGTDVREVGFQEYFVGLRHAVPVRAVRFDGVGAAQPAPGVIEAIAAAEVLVICPSNPVVSIGPVVAVPGVAGSGRPPTGDHGGGLADRRGEGFEGPG